MIDRSDFDAPDLFSELLDQWKFHGDPGFHGEFSAPWGLAVEATPGRAPFYVVASGRVRLEVGRQSHDLGDRDLVVLPRGSAHTLTSGPGARPLVGPEWAAPPQGGMRHLAGGGGGEVSHVVGGTFRFESPFALPVLGALEEAIVLRAEATLEGIESLLGLFCHEGRSPTPGHRAVLSGLLKLLFIQIMRVTLSGRNPSGHCPQSPLVLLVDPSLRVAAEAMHFESHKTWTIEALASLVGMSRTTFAVRFQGLTGTSPLAYLTQVRMLQATNLLETTSLTLEAVAKRVGYGSEAAFSSAFRRELGVAPGAWRKRPTPLRLSTVALPG